MINKWRFHKLDAFHLNVGVPIVITMIFVIVNFEIFELVFVEKFTRLLLMYFYIAMVILILRVIWTRTQKVKKKVLKLSMYEFGVLNSVLILMFLFINLNCSDKIYTKKILVDRNLISKLEKLPVKKTYLKVFEINQKEYDKYYNKTYIINIQINRSCFGYDFLKSRTFEKI